MDVEKILKDMRPSLRKVAPLTYYISWGFALFNMCVSIPLYRINEHTFLIVGAIDLKVWAIMFFSVGLLYVYALINNNWRLDRNLMLVGAFMKTAWLMELIARSVNGKSLILVAIWSLLLYLQIVTYIYFAPVEIREDG